MSGPLLTLKEAAELCQRELIPSGKVTVRTLRTEREKGTLRVHKIGGIIYTTRLHLEAMIRASECPEPQKVHVSTSVSEPVARRNMSSEMDRAKLAQSSARIALEKLKRPSATISRINTARRPVPDAGSQTS